MIPQASLNQHRLRDVGEAALTFLRATGKLCVRLEAYLGEQDESGARS